MPISHTTSFFSLLFLWFLLFADEKMSRKYAYVVYGATGYTGELVAQYLANKYPKGSVAQSALIVAMLLQRAGQLLVATRKNSTLSSARSSKSTLVCSLSLLCVAHSSSAACEAVDVLVASPTDQKSVDAVVAQTRVLIACVGPFALHGESAVAACARLGTDCEQLQVSCCSFLPLQTLISLESRPGYTPCCHSITHTLTRVPCRFAR